MNRSNWVSGKKRKQTDYPYVGDVWQRPDGKFYYVAAVVGDTSHVSPYSPRKGEVLEQHINRAKQNINKVTKLRISSKDFKNLKRVFSKESS